MRKLLMLALCLTPFSNSANNDMPIISFGLPLIFLALVLSLMNGRPDGYAMPRHVRNALVAAAGVLAIMSATSLIAPHLDASLVRLVPNLACFALAARMLQMYCRNPESMLEYGLKALAISGALMSVYYIANLASAVAVYGLDAVMRERYVGGLAALPWGASNMVSAALIYPHIACHLLRWRYRTWWADALLGLILVATVLTMSRAGMVTHGAVLIFGAMYSRNYRYIVYGTIVIMVFGAAYASIDPDSFNYLWSDRFEGTGADLSNGRLDTWREKAVFVSDNFMSPIGYYASLYEFHGLTAHNFVLTLLVEQGSPGMLAFLFFCYFALAALYKKRSIPWEDAVFRRILAFGSMAAFGNLQVEDANFNHPYIIYFWMYFLIAMLFTLTLRTAVPADRRIFTGAVHHA